MNTFRGFLIFVAMVSGIGSFGFGNKETRDNIEQVVANSSHSGYNTQAYRDIRYTVTSQSGMNGGAIGLGLISGMCFIAAAITFIGKEEKDFYKN